MNEKHTFQLPSVQCGHLDPSDFPYQQRSEQEMSGNLLSEAMFRWRLQRGRRKESRERDDERLQGECPGKTSEHLCVRVQGLKHIALKSSQVISTCCCPSLNCSMCYQYTVKCAAHLLVYLTVLVYRLCRVIAGCQNCYCFFISLLLSWTLFPPQTLPVALLSPFYLSVSDFL